MTFLLFTENILSWICQNIFPQNLLFCFLHCWSLDFLQAELSTYFTPGKNNKLLICMVGDSKRVGMPISLICACVKFIKFIKWKPFHKIVSIANMKTCHNHTHTWGSQYQMLDYVIPALGMILWALALWFAMLLIL